MISSSHAIFAILLVFFTRCGADLPSEQSHLQEVNTDSHLADTVINSQTVTAATQFRDNFFSYVPTPASSGSLSQMLFLPNQLVEDKLTSQTPLAFIKQLHQIYANESPENRYAESQKIAHQLYPTSDLDNQLRNKPITIVVVPGIFSEFIDTRAFEEIFSQTDSAYHKRWEKLLRAQKYYNPHAPGLTDNHFSLNAVNSENNGIVSSPIEALIHTASIDDEAGNPLVNLVLCHAPLLSLESVDDIDQVSNILLRRLNKFFSIQGIPENLVFLGYSRGATTALDLLAKAEQTQQIWLQNVRGLVSLGGVTYGSDIADQIYVTNSDQYKSFHLMKNLVQQLEETEKYPWFTPFSDDKSKWDVFDQNQRAWLTFLRQAAALGQVPKADDLRMMSTTDIRSMLGLATRIASQFDLANLATEYSTNIRKFKRVVQAILTGSSQLTTKARLQWWKTHTIPTTGITYYAVAGTMFDPKTSSQALSLSRSASTYNAKSYDYQILSSGYLDYKSVANLPLNDSQVAACKVRFWPQVASILNPQQQSFSAKFLGIMNVHHWGLTLETVNVMKDRSKNPFPRTALLKALSVTIANDL